MKHYQIKKINPEYKDEITKLLEKYWGSVEVVSRGRIFIANELPGFIAIQYREIVGLITYQIENDQCEIVTLNSLIRGKGIGGKLVQMVRSEANVQGCQRVCLITTNDNVNAIRFYQKRGFNIAAIHRDAIQQSRFLKPSVPLLGCYDIPIKDEIEFELLLREHSSDSR